MTGLFGHPTRDTIVKEFDSRRKMQRSVDRLARDGYRVEHQSGEFSHRPAFRWNRRRVVVTFRHTTND